MCFEVKEHSEDVTVYFFATGSPFAVPMLDGLLAVAFGPGLQRAVSHQPASFTVDTCAVGGDAPISVSVVCK